MSITGLAIRRDRLTLVILFAVFLTGISTYIDMPRNQDPGFTMRLINVVTVFPGGSPDRVEKLISDHIEKAAQELPEVDWIRSTSRAEVSVVQVMLKAEYSDLEPIWERLRRKIDKVRPLLPAGIVGPTVDSDFAVFGIVLGLEADGYDITELKAVADEMREELLKIEDASRVKIYGVQPEQIFVEYSHKRLASLGLSPQALIGILQARNILRSGGVISVGDSAVALPERIALEPSGSFESLEDLRNLVIPIPGRKEVTTLGDIATVRRAYVDPPATEVRMPSRAKGGVTYAACNLPDIDPDWQAEWCKSNRLSLSLGIAMRDGGNIIQLGEDARKMMAELEARYPVGVELTEVAFLPREVQRVIDNFETSLLQAVGIVLLVMLITLGVRTGTLVATLVPTTMIGTILIMNQIGVGLDQISIVSLIIALGMLVDNAIVVSEAMMVEMSRGKKPVQAALDATKELQVPLLTSSLTTAAAFMPIALADSVVGEFMGPLFVVLTISLIVSWLLSITLIPLLATKFMKVEQKSDEEAYGGRFYRAHRRILDWMLRHKLLSCLGTVGAFVGGMSIFALVPVIFFPPSDQPLMTVQIELPRGAPIESSSEVVSSIAELIETEMRAEDGREGVTDWAAYLGGGEPQFALNYAGRMQDPSYTLMLINTSNGPIIDDLMPRIERHARDNFPDVDLTVRRMDTGPGVAYPIELRLSGRTVAEVFAIVDDVKAKLDSMTGIKNVIDDWGSRTKKLIVDVNQARARRAGVTNDDIAVSLQTVLSGIATTQFREESSLIPITIRSVAADRQDVGKIESLLVYGSQTGQAVPLKQVADVYPVWEPSQIHRYNLSKTVTVKTQIELGANANALTAELVAWLETASKDWPAGSSFAVGGEAEQAEQSNQSIVDKLPIAGFVILILLIAQFNSVRKTTIVLSTIPLGLIGVGIGLFLARSSFGFMTFLGVISLAGIVINNAIVLLERIDYEREEKQQSHFEAVLNATQTRMRPIVLATATTIGGLMPLWIGGSEMWKPMAIAIIFGLLFSTLLTLLVVPVFYAILFRVKPETP